MKRKTGKPQTTRPKPAEVDVIKALTEELTVPVSVAAKALGTGPYAIRQSIRRKEIDAIRVGRVDRVITAPLRRRLGVGPAE